MGFKPGQSGNPNGRPKGSRNKASVEREAEIKASGLAPLEYMLNVLRDENATKEDRMWAADKAAPYVHPRLQAIAHTGEGGGPVPHEHRLAPELNELIERTLGRPAKNEG